MASVTDAADATRRAAMTPISALSRLPTGAKLFITLSIALLLLALIAIAATLQTGRVADAEVRARLRIAATESARNIAIELIGDTTALQVAVEALREDPADAPSCARAQGVFAQQAAIGTRFSIVDRRGRLLCGQAIDASLPSVDKTMDIAVLGDRGLVLSVAAPGGSPIARVLFPTAFLSRLAASGSRAVPLSTALVDGANTLSLTDIPGLGPLDRIETVETPIGLDGLMLRTSMRSAPITSSFLVALMLPLLMWAAAAGLSWFVVDRLLIRPLPAQEIRELGDTFRAISRTVALHEAGLADAVVRQTKLTREVHHRVKNNLQVISSLINFHARGAPSADATAAYASIQRRVDALAVVHRNHFAEMEENRGLNLRSVIGELASNIRATAPEGASSLVIALDVDPFLVNQDVAVAVAFLVTETIELAMTCDPAAQIRVAIKPGEEDKRATLRVVSRAFVESETLTKLLSTRYGRVIEGLSRQLRAPLHHDPMTGAYEIAFTIPGRD